jgi:hypothetical protein
MVDADPRAAPSPGLATAGNGDAVRIWAVSPAMTAATQRVPGTDQATTIRAWQARQLSATATPYGVAHSLVGIGGVHQDGNRRTPLETISYDIPQRSAAPAVVDRAADALATAALLAATTHVAVSRLSFGDMLKALLPEEGRRRPWPPFSGRRRHDLGRPSRAVERNDQRPWGV